MAADDLKKRVEILESQVAQIQSSLVMAGAANEKNWRRAVDKYVGDEDLLAVFAEAKKLREAERKEVRRGRAGRSKP